jgi:lactate dehydrogenase-like 2-hydroxyacid dehydrogenase
LVEKCHVISTHLPRHTQLLDRDLLKRFGPNKVLVNTGLTPSYDTDYFKTWIQSNFAIIDKVSLTDNLLDEHMTYSNLVLSNKVTGFTKNARERLAYKVVENIKSITS